MTRLVAFALALVTAGSVVKAQQQPPVTGTLTGPIIVGGVDGKRSGLSLKWADGHTTGLTADMFQLTLQPNGFTVTAGKVQIVTRQRERTFTATWPNLKMDVRNSGLVSIIGPN